MRPAIRSTSSPASSPASRPTLARFSPPRLSAATSVATSLLRKKLTAKFITSKVVDSKIIDNEELAKTPSSLTANNHANYNANNNANNNANYHANYNGGILKNSSEGTSSSRSSSETTFASSPSPTAPRPADIATSRQNSHLPCGGSKPRIVWQQIQRGECLAFERSGQIHLGSTPGSATSPQIKRHLPDHAATKTLDNLDHHNCSTLKSSHHRPTSCASGSAGRFSSPLADPSSPPPSDASGHSRANSAQNKPEDHTSLTEAYSAGAITTKVTGASAYDHGKSSTDSRAGASLKSSSSLAHLGPSKISMTDTSGAPHSLPELPEGFQKDLQVLFGDLKKELVSGKTSLVIDHLKLLREEKQIIITLAESYIQKVKSMSEDILEAKNELIELKEQSINHLKHRVTELTKELAIKQQEVEDLEVLNKALSGSPPPASASSCSPPFSPAVHASSPSSLYSPTSQSASLGTDSPTI